MRTELTDQEENELRKEIARLNEREAESIFRIETSWERKGRLEGRSEGRLEERREVVHHMLAKGLKVEELADFTGLPSDEIRRL